MVRRTAGVTLVELIIVLAIMSIVIVAGFQVHAFSQRTASRGLIEAQIQTQQRMAADFVLRELRYAGNVRIMADMPAAASIDLNTRYIFIHSSGVPYIMESGVARAIPGVENTNTASMQFTPIDNQTVGFRIETENKGQTHVLESSVALLNETGLPETPSTGSVIAYGDAQYALFQSVEVGGGIGGTGGTGGGVGGSVVLNPSVVSGGKTQLVISLGVSDTIVSATMSPAINSIDWSTPGRITYLHNNFNQNEYSSVVRVGGNDWNLTLKPNRNGNAYSWTVDVRE